MSKSMRLVFFTLPGLIVRFNWRFPIGTHRSSASHACNRAADHFIVQPCPHAVGVVIDRAVFTNTKMLCRLDGVNIGAEEQEFPTILALLVLDHLLNTSAIDSVFHTTAPMSAAEQKEAFQNALSEALGDACNMELVQSIHDRLRDQIEQHKESHDPEPLELSVSDAAAILRDNGVEEEKILAFRDNCFAQFGDGATLNPANLIDSSRFEVKTADATISLDPEHSYLVETRIIDGRKYLLIPADEDIEVNGFGVRVKGE